VTASRDQSSSLHILADDAEPTNARHTPFPQRGSSTSALAGWACYDITR
jgi:hypothetical protein